MIPKTNPPGRTPDRTSTLTIVLVACIGGFLLLFLMGAFAHRITTQAEALKTQRDDPGIAACREMAHELRLTNQILTTRNEQTAGQIYQVTRESFAHSKDHSIIDNGVRFVDLLWQIRTSPEVADLLTGDLTSAYQGLAGACATHGYAINA